MIVEKLDLEEGEEVVFDTVVAVNNRALKIGTPYVAGATVKATVQKHGKGKKITIFKYTAKKVSTRRKQGHRQPYTSLVINEINSY